MLRCFLVFICLVCTQLMPAEAKRVALVIGNNAYEKLRPLEKAGNDAGAIRDLLVSKEFDVIFKTDTDLKTFKQSLFDFSAKIGPDDIAVFYYAGHGAALNGVNYLMPVDVPLPVVSDPNHLENLQEDEVRAEQERLAEYSVKESLVLGQIAKRKPKVSLVILDNCRNNPLRVEDAGDSPFRDAASGDIVFGADTNTGEKKQSEGMIIVYSASFGQRALDLVPGQETAPNSPFTTALLENFKTPGLGLKQVIQKTREDIYQLAKSINYSQSPAVYDQLFGDDVYLSGKPAILTKDAGEAALAAAGDNRAMLKVVIESFPGTVWAKLAAVKLEEQVAVLAPPKPAEPECAGIATTVQGETRCLNPGDAFTDCVNCPEMVVVPAGSFMMGSLAGEADRQEDEGPQHKVTLSKSFAVGKFEVTRGQFAEFVKDANYTPGSSCWIWNGTEWKDTAGESWKDTGYKQTDEHPVACVSWDDAQAYIKWLSKKSGVGYRLLTEAEFEYANRAGTTTAFPTGESITTAQANFNNEKQATTVIGAYAANKFGLFDMAGNVWEWTEDCYEDSYKNASIVGKATQGSSCARVKRGGGCSIDSQVLRSADRNGVTSDLRDFDLGFRLARTF